MLAWLWRRKGAAEVERLLQVATEHYTAGRVAQAEAAYRMVIEADPSSFRAHYNLGLARLALGERAAAAASLQEAVRLQPQLAEAHYLLGHLFCDDDRAEEGLACFRRALEIQPEHAQARWSLALGGIPQVYGNGEDPARVRRELAAGLAELERWFDTPARAAAAEAVVGLMQPFSLAYEEQPNRELLERHGRLCVRLMSEWERAQGLSAAVGRGGAAVRVGVVSAHLRDHSVWHAIVKSWFQELDRDRFALCAFHLGMQADAETDYARSRAAHFETGPKTLRQWVDAIRSQQPDVLLYPEIGMDPTALKLASLRLAPVQAASWGHPETSGLPTIDYFLSARDMEPPGAQVNYSEKLVALPNLGCFFEPRPADGPRPRLRELGIAEDRPVLVCPGVPFKYAPQHDWVFPELARRLGRCQFVFFNHRAQAQMERLRGRLRAAFTSRGLDPERFLVFTPWLTKAAFQGIMSQAQACLDTIGFSGFNTALQAVQAGLPIVTREGRFLRGRFASGILKRMGISELVAASDQLYVDLAERMVRDGACRERLAARIKGARESLYRDAAPIAALQEFLLGAQGR
jgi:predicted O-linked N-acetylglucosamine transferase (SPINDLY family)